MKTYIAAGNPLVSVILPVYNTKLSWFKLAFESIINQSYINLEIIVIDDGSTIDFLYPQKEYINSFNDQRIIYIENNKNKGIAYVLNQAVKISSGEFIARMDADDISLTRRLEKQISFLIKNKEVEIVGSWTKTFDQSDYLNKRPIGVRENRCHLIFKTTLTHSSVLFRSSFFKKLLYDVMFVPAEDYELWARAIINEVSIDNTNEVLLFNRAISGRKIKYSTRDKLIPKIHSKLFKHYFNFEPTNRELHIHKLLTDYDSDIDIELIDLIKWLDKINNLNFYFDKKLLLDTSSYYLTKYFYNSPNIYDFKYIMKKSNYRITGLSGKEFLKMLLKMIFFQKK